MAADIGPETGGNDYRRFSERKVESHFASHGSQKSHFRMAVPQDSETYSGAEDKTHIQVLRRIPMLQYIVLKIGKPYSRDVFAGP